MNKMNILSFDIEEWFHLLDFDATRTEAEWGKYEVRIYDNVERLLRILDETGTKATFFIIGWIAKNYPDLVKRISEKYQIGSHTMNHQLVWQQKPEEFRKDVMDSVKCLQDITGKPVEFFRAPGFSITENEGWAFEVLQDADIIYDSSVFPSKASHGGMPSYCGCRPAIIKSGSASIREFPISYRNVLGKHLIFNGGGYFRLCPYPLMRKWSESDYLLSYIHPRDLDAGQPMLEGLPLSRKFKSYVGLKGAENKLRKYLGDFSFTDIATASQMTDWTDAPIVNI